MRKRNLSLLMTRFCQNKFSIFLSVLFILGILRQTYTFQTESKVISKDIENKIIRSRFSQRKEILNAYCDKKLDDNELKLEEYHFIERLPRPLVFCTPKKVGSLSLSSYFTNDVDEEDQLSWMLGPVHDSREYIFQSRNPLKAMVTRHPLERLASAYKHLFITGLDDFNSFLCANGPKCEITQNAYLAQQIIRKIRHEVNPSETSLNLSFSEFVSFVVDSGQQFGDLKREMGEEYPGIGAHWEPYHRWVQPGISFSSK